MVFVGIPDDGPGGKAIHESAALQSIDNAGCDIITKRRVREVYEVPGALWHIFDAIDADKIRDFLNMVCSSHLSYWTRDFLICEFTCLHLLTRGGKTPFKQFHRSFYIVYYFHKIICPCCYLN